MSRYIDADALEYDTEWSEYHDGFTAYSQMAIDTAPCIDIVKCKECIHCADDYIDVGMGTMPQFTCELGRCGESVQPNDFCSYGERKDDEF